MPSVPESATTPGWLLDEIANAGRENLDADPVSRYVSKEDAGAADEVLFCHLPDFWEAVALAGIHHILRPGGLLRLWDVVYNFDPSRGRGSHRSLVSTGNATADDGWSRGELDEHVRDEHSTFSRLLER